MAEVTVSLTPEQINIIRSLADSYARQLGIPQIQELLAHLADAAKPITPEGPPAE